MFMKPYDGGGWRAVTKVDDAAAAEGLRGERHASVMHLQAAVNDFDRFVRCIGFGPQTHTCSTTRTRRSTIATREDGLHLDAEEEHLAR